MKSLPCHRLTLVLALLLSLSAASQAQVLDKQRQLDSQTFWDNRDWDWYIEHIPFFECPDADITTTYYYRWELLTKHLTYGSPSSGYSFTEFIDRPFWSGAYGAISCPAGHQLYEARWLRRPRIARDYLRYWFRTPGAQPRNYSTWLADSAWAVHQVHPEDRFLIDLLPDLIKNYEAWEDRHFVPEVGLFWQTGHDDGMEFNINSRQTQDILRGAPSYRPSFNAYMWADARAIAAIARLAGNEEVADQYERKAANLKQRMLTVLWDERRQFFFSVFKNDEERDGYKILALTKTYETGRFAGDSHGRELIGYVPWQFNMIDPNSPQSAAWAKLMDRNGFFADFGPTTVEREDPMFLLKDSCCWWSGQSWPYATTQTLKGLANLLQSAERTAAPRGVDAAIQTIGIPTKADYLRLLQIYARSHRKNGRPYLAEALHPDTGSFEGHDAYNHSEHYFHSGFCDLVITGLIGLTPRDDGTLELNPLAPTTWEYFALDNVPYHHHDLSIIWDRTGQRYGVGAGFHVLLDGRKIGSSDKLERMIIDNALPRPSLSSNDGTESTAVLTNFAVNNDGDYFPRLVASHTGPNSSPTRIVDGNYWYHQDPPNRWTTVGSQSDTDELILDLGVTRRVHTAKLYFLDDESAIVPPRSFTMETWRDGRWQPLSEKNRSPRLPTGRRPNLVRFPEQDVNRLRIVFTHAKGGRTGLTEFELWGHAELPVAPPPPPSGNLAYRNPTQQGGFPRITASHTSRHDRIDMANDGRAVFTPTPHNRWTAYESTSPTDWLEIDFGRTVEFRRVELAIYDDRGGVQPPDAYTIEFWTDGDWRQVGGMTQAPEQPIGSQWNEARFDPVRSSKLRIVFAHHGQARSGVTEVLVWND